VSLSPFFVLTLNAMLQENRAYLAVFGLTGLAAMGMNALFERAARRSRRLAWGVGAATGLLIAACGIGVIRQNTVWHDDWSLWSDVIRKNPESTDAHLGLGTLYQSEKRFDLAVREYQAVLSMKSGDYRARGNMAQIFLSEGRYDAAIAEYRRVLVLVPRDIGARYRLGLSYQGAGRWREAAGEFQKVLQMDPQNAAARYRLQQTEATAGKVSRR
jgi:tetratricopeptide (TPR) repeat protein